MSYNFRKYSRNNSIIPQSSAEATASHVGAYIHGLKTKIQDGKEEKEKLEKRVQELDALISSWEEQLKASVKPSSQGGRSKRKTHRKRK